MSGATNASPIVISTAAAHGYVTGDQVRVLSIGGNTAANGLWYVDVLSPTTFALYSDANLSIPSTGNGAYTSGGTVTQSLDVSTIVTDWTLGLRLDSLTANKNFVVTIQEPEDGFVSDIRTLWTLPFVGPVSGGAVVQTLRKYELTDNRFGTMGTYGDALRINVQAIDSGATATLSFFGLPSEKCNCSRSLLGAWSCGLAQI